MKIIYGKLVYFDKKKTKEDFSLVRQPNFKRKEKTFKYVESKAK